MAILGSLATGLRRAAVLSAMLALAGAWPSVVGAQTAMAFGATYRGVIAAAAAPGVYTFTGALNDVVFLRVALPHGSGIWPGLRVFDPNGAMIVSMYSSQTIDKAINIDMPGVYTVQVYDGFNNSRTGGYLVYAQRLNNPGNAAAIAYGATANGRVNVTTGAPNLISTYTVQATAGDTLFARLASLTTSGFYPRIWLCAPDGTMLLKADGNPTAELRKTVAAAGTYTYLVCDYFAGEAFEGDFAFYAQRINNPGGATDLGVGRYTNTTITPAGAGNANLVSTYVFQGSANDVVYARCVHPWSGAGDLWPGMQLYGPNGDQLFLQTGSVMAQGIATLPSSGRHVLLVHDGFNGLRGGQLGFTLQRMNDPQNAAPLAPGVQVTPGPAIANIGQVDTYTFNGSIGNLATITAARTSGSLWPWVRVFLPPATWFDPASSSATTVWSQTLANAGRFTVIVSDGFDGANTGPYSMRLERTGDLVPTALAVPNASGPGGSSVNLQATLTRTDVDQPIAGKPVAFTLAGTAVGSAQTSVAGVATLSTVITGEQAARTLGASSVADYDFAAASGSGTLTQTASDSTLTMPDRSGQLGGAVTLTATLKRAADAAPLAGKAVTFLLNGSAIGSWNTNASGVASAPTTVPSSLTPGAKPLAADFGGDALNRPAGATATLSVLKADTTVSVPAASGVIGASTALAATLKRATDASPLVGRPLTFSVDGTTVGSATTAAGGAASMAYTVPAGSGPGSRALGALFGGDASHNGSSGSGALQVRAATSLYAPDRSGVIGETTYLRAYLRRTTDNATISGRAVAFSVAGASVGSANTDAAGHASLAWVITPGAASRALSASFAGDDLYTGSAGSGALTAQTLATKVYVVDRTQKIRQYTVLKVYLYTLANAVIPNKPITVKVDGASIGTANTNASCYVQFGYTVPEGGGSGVRTISGAFAGDLGYLASSNTGKLTATKGNLYLWLYIRSGKRGADHPLRAYVRSLPDYVIQPGKSITFKVNGTTIGTAAAAADGWAAATWSIPAGEPTGAHTGAAEFSGDAWYSATAATSAFNVVP
ncbi:MAG: hypothetical protein NT029_11135 [Armatimonadetes bacterium]|nr:hypothetical protein [Armatimonadota bacterium]